MFNPSLKKVVTKPPVCSLSLQRSCQSCRAEWPRSAKTKDEVEDPRCLTGPVRVSPLTSAPCSHLSRFSSSHLSSDVELEQIDFIDSCVEEEEEGKSRGGRDSSSLSSQFMAYIERRITREVGARFFIFCNSELLSLDTISLLTCRSSMLL